MESGSLQRSPLYTLAVMSQLAVNPMKIILDNPSANNLAHRNGEIASKPRQAQRLRPTPLDHR